MSPDAPDATAQDQANSGFAYAEFTPVKSRKNRKNNKRSILKDRLSITPIEAVQRLRESMRKGDDWFTEASRILSGALAEPSLQSGSGPIGASDKLHSVLCLGLGSPTNSSNSNAQLAFLLELVEHLNLASDCVSLYDPVFTEQDTALFKQLGLTVLSENRDGRYELHTPTLCVMLHCDMELYNSILETNWNAEGLANLILVGNRLTDYIDSNPSHKLQATVPYLFHIAPMLECRALAAAKQWPTAFTNTCVQFIPRADVDLEAVLAKLATAEKPPPASSSLDESDDVVVVVVEKNESPPHSRDAIKKKEKEEEDDEKKEDEKEGGGEAGEPKRSESVQAAAPDAEGLAEEGKQDNGKCRIEPS